MTVLRAAPTAPAKPLAQAQAPLVVKLKIKTVTKTTVQ